MPDVFVGRVNERAVVRDLLQRARGGHPRPLVVRGDAGIGKSSLLGWVLTEAEQSGMRTVAAGADRVDAGVPYAALRLALDVPLAEETDPSLITAASDLRAALARNATPASRDEVQLLLQRVVEGWAFRSPVLFGFDDLHHADAHTASAVLHLMRNVRGQRVLVVGTTRREPFLDGDTARTLDALRCGDLVEVVDLGALDAAELGELVRRRTDLEPTEQLVRLLQQRTGGAPFFVIELLAAMSRAGHRHGADDAGEPLAPEELTLPLRVTTAVLHRVFALGADARAVASAAAVLDRVPSGGLSLLAAAAELDVARTSAAFARLVEAGLLVADGADHRFAHAIVRDALYDDIGPAARRRLHGRVAQVLSGEGWHDTDVVEVARHVLGSTTGRDSAAAATLVAAGDSVADLAPRAAIAWYSAALARLGPRDEGVIPIQLALARALDLSGDHLHGMRVAEAALANVVDPAVRRRAIGRAARSLSNAGQRDRAVALLDATLADPGTRSPALLLDLAEALLWTDRQHEVPALVAEARAHGDERYRPLLDATEMHAAVGVGDFGVAAEIHRRLLGGLDAIAGPARLTTRMSVCAVGAFNFDPAVAAAVADAVDPAEPMAGWLASIAAWARYRLGRYADVAASTAQARVDLAVGDGRPSTGVWLAALIATGVERADPDVPELLAIADAAGPAPIFATGVDIGRAMWHRQRGEHEAAAALLDTAAERERTRGQINFLATALAGGVDAAIARHDDRAARRLEAELAELADAASVATTMHCLLARTVARDDLDAARGGAGPCRSVRAGRRRRSSPRHGRAAERRRRRARRGVPGARCDRRRLAPTGGRPRPAPPRAAGSPRPARIARSQPGRDRGRQPRDRRSHQPPGRRAHEPQPEDRRGVPLAHLHQDRAPLAGGAGGRRRDGAFSRPP